MPNSNLYAMSQVERKLSQAEICPQIEALAAAYYSYICRLACSILDDPGEADDVAQETFIAAARALQGFRKQATPKTWLTSIAVNLCRGRLRRRRARATLQAALESLHFLRTPGDPEQISIQNENHRQLWQAVDALDEKHRLPIILRYVHELTIPEIAESLGLNQGTVHSRLHYARQKLMSQLGDVNPRMEVNDGAA
ncbi:MAG: RNA polymerase sigma factor [Anaerolineales bacterium]|nr:RNA polymerase sigma factor [Anaerolineales bacterium]